MYLNKIIVFVLAALSAISITFLLLFLITLRRTYFCGKCGNRVFEEDNYCSNCGFKLIKEDNDNENKDLGNS